LALYEVLQVGGLRPGTDCCLSIGGLWGLGADLWG
jgi:hypothetical protein